MSESFRLELDEAELARLDEIERREGEGTVRVPAAKPVVRMVGAERARLEARDVAP